MLGDEAALLGVLVVLEGLEVLLDCLCPFLLFL